MHVHQIYNTAGAVGIHQIIIDNFFFSKKKNIQHSWSSRDLPFNLCVWWIIIIIIIIIIIYFYFYFYFFCLESQLVAEICDLKPSTSGSD